MTATTSQKIGAGRLLTAFATSATAAGPPGDTPPRSDAASAGTRQDIHQGLEGALARGERAVFDRIRGLRDRLRDRLVRRPTVRELRIMGRSRLADIGIEPDGIEPVVDAMLAARRDRAAGQRGRGRPRSE